MSFEQYSQGLWVPPPAPPKRSHARAVIALGVLAAVALGALGIVSNRQHIVDQWTVLTFTPSATITAYIDRAALSDHGRFLLLASKPTVLAADEFNRACANQEEGSGVLGCYVTPDQVITLFDVTDPQLDGLEEVVAAHEMLHAAWDRMSLDQQHELEPLLEEAFATQSGNADLVARMELYARTEPGERANELHSIIGTEVADLSPELEAYYDQYFDDRPALVALHLKSNAVFVELEAKSAALVKEIEDLNAGITTDGAAYNSGYDQLNADIEAFNQRADNGQFSSQEQFDTERAALLARQADLDALLTSIKAREATRDAKITELEQLDAQAAALSESVNVVPRTTG